MTCITKRDSKQLASGSPASAAAGGSRIETTDKGQKSYETLANRTPRRLQEGEELRDTAFIRAHHIHRSDTLVGFTTRLLPTVFKNREALSWSLADAPMAEAATAESLKAEGNAFFAKEEWLKARCQVKTLAAACYTKAIKLDAENAVLYSNRSAAFVNLSKASQALSDAETAIRLRPDWPKGYYRKGCALELSGKAFEAIAAFQRAVELEGHESAEIKGKIRALRLQKQRGAAETTAGLGLGAATGPAPGRAGAQRPKPPRSDSRLAELVRADILKGHCAMRVTWRDLRQAGLADRLIFCSVCGDTAPEDWMGLERTVPPSNRPIPREALRLSCVECLVRSAEESRVPEDEAAVGEFVDSRCMGSREICWQLMGYPKETWDGIHGSGNTF